MSKFDRLAMKPRFIIVSCLLLTIAASPAPANPTGETNSSATDARMSTEELIMQMVNKVFQSNEASIRQSREQVHRFTDDHPEEFSPAEKISIKDYAELLTGNATATQETPNELNSEEPKITTIHLTASTPMPYMHLVAVSSDQPTTIETSEDSDVFYSDNSSAGQRRSSMVSVQDDDVDRHIQYDVVQPSRTILYANGDGRLGVNGSHILLNYEAEKLTSVDHLPAVELSSALPPVAEDQRPLNYSAPRDSLEVTNRTQGEKLDGPQDEKSLESNLLANNSLGPSEPMTTTSASTLSAPVTLEPTPPDQQQQEPAENQRSARKTITQARSLGSGALTRILHHSMPPYASVYNQASAYQNRAIPATETADQVPKPSVGTAPREVDGARQNSEQTISTSDGLARSSTPPNSGGTHTGQQNLKPLEPQSDSSKQAADQTSGGDRTSNQLQKLASSIDQFVDLNPIPSIASPTNSLDMDEQPSRYFDTTVMEFDRTGVPFEDRAPQQKFGANNQRPQDSMTTQRVTYPTKIASDFKTIGSATQQPLVDSSLSLPTMSVHRRTFESVGNQLHNSDRNEIGSHSSPVGGTTHTAPITQLSPFAGHNFHHRVGQNFAASLINVTAPMTPPISASEAMQSSLDPQAAKNLMHQASGLLGYSGAATGSSGHAQNRTKPHQQSTQPPISSHLSSPMETQQPRVFSHPANSLPSQKGSPYNFLHAIEDLSSANELSSNLNESLKTRFDGLPVYPRGSTSHYPIASDSAHRHQNHAQASGFRSPSSLLSTQTPLSAPNLFHNGASITPTADGHTPTAQASSATQQIRPGQVTTPLPHQLPPTLAPASASSTVSSTTNGFITGSVTSAVTQGPSGTGAGGQLQVNESQAGGSKRVFNLTRVEHISAECSNDMIRTVIVFNGTFKGIIYSSGYVREPNCLYVNGTGKTRYDFSIRLNECGTLGRQEVHPSSGPNAIRRRDQVMWNTLSIQYNPIIEQEWDEHFRVSCEYGSDFWKTVSFSPFNVETNTGSPVVFTVDPPQCQMEILRGHGMVGPRQETISGPVTVGDPLTLLIHMKSERAGYDIIVKNCIAHNGNTQKMQLIDSNGCVVNERFVSPFRGTYNDNDLKHVTLYSYLKAFRFTGRPVLYIECEVHMCQSACPPQMCYWRRLSKRSTNETEDFSSDDNYLSDQDFATRDPTTTLAPTSVSHRQLKRFNFSDDNQRGNSSRARELTSTRRPNKEQPLSDSLSLTQWVEVREDPAIEGTSPFSSSFKDQWSVSGRSMDSDSDSLMCYPRAEVFAFFFTTASALLAAISIAVGCCWRAASLTNAKRLYNERKKLYYMGAIY